VLRQPPPSHLAPIPANNTFRNLFIIIVLPEFTKVKSNKKLLHLDLKKWLLIFRGIN
jgi:hypothetical protein